MDELMVADRSFPAYLYPLVWQLNHPEDDEQRNREATLKAFWTHLQLTSENTRTPLELRLSQGIPDEELIWDELLESVRVSWSLRDDCSESERSRIERVLFVGTLAPFPGRTTS